MSQLVLNKLHAGLTGLTLEYHRNNLTALLRVKENRV